MDLSIIIPTTKDRDLIFKEVLHNAIAAIQDIDAQIIVVSDSEGYMPSLPVNSSKVEVFRNPHKGAASARNFGAKNALGHLLLFLDNDIIVSTTIIKHIINVHQELPNACINPDWVYPDELRKKLIESNFGKLLEATGMTSHKGWFGNSGWQDNALFKVGGLASFHLSISRSNFEKSGGYDSSFPFAGMEDYDFSKKLVLARLDLYIDTRIVVYHNEVDKLDVKIRLNNQKNRSVTRKTAVKLGYSEAGFEYGFLKASILKFTYFFRTPLIGFLKILPNKKPFYMLYSKIYPILEASYIYKGYTD